MPARQNGTRVAFDDRLSRARYTPPPLRSRYPPSRGYDGGGPAVGSLGRACSRLARVRTPLRGDRRTCRLIEGAARGRSRSASRCRDQRVDGPNITSLSARRPVQLAGVAKSRGRRSADRQWENHCCRGGTRQRVQSFSCPLSDARPARAMGAPTPALLPRRYWYCR
jgi:hypothetical protein